MQVLDLSLIESLATLRNEKKAVGSALLALPHKDRGEMVLEKGRICLAVRNLWDDFLFRLGDFDEDRSNPDVKYCDDDRLQYASEDIEVARDVLTAINDGQRLLEQLGIPSTDQYVASIAAKAKKLASVIGD